MIVQTLVENAVKHGIAKSRGPGWIRVTISPAKDGYSVVVANSAAAQNRQDTEGTGSGLELTRKRLMLLYGDKADLTLQYLDDETQVAFWISGGKGTPSGKSCLS